MTRLKKILLPVAVIFVIMISGCSKKEFQVEKDVEPVSENNSSCAYLTEDNAGNPVLVWVEFESQEHEHGNEHDHSNHGSKKQPGSVFYAVSKDNGATFGEKIKVVSGVGCHTESMPKVAFNKDGKVYAFYDRKLDSEKNKWASAVYYIYSDDGGKTWSDEEMLSTDKSPDNSRNFFDVTTLPDGSIGATWLDGREEKTGLYFAKTDEQGKFSSDKKIASEVCECCRTVIFVDSKSNINIVYRDVLEDGARDMGFVMSSNDGDTFTEPVLISKDNWVIEACPHTGPAVTESDGRLYFTWFTRGNGTGLFYNFTPIGQTEFSLRNVLTSNQSAKHPQIATVGEGVVTVWEQNASDDNQNNVITLKYLTSSGEQYQTAISDENYRSSFPVILKVNDKNVLVAWTMKDGNSERVVYKKINLDELLSNPA